MKKVKPRIEKKSLKVKDLTPKRDEARNVKGGAVGPCDRSKK